MVYGYRRPAFDDARFFGRKRGKRILLDNKCFNFYHLPLYGTENLLRSVIIAL